MEDPNRAKPKSAIAEPMLPKLRRLSEEPSITASRTLTALPKRVVVNNAMVDPRRPRLRMLRLLPRCRKSSTEIAKRLPNRTDP
jgi:hypothetical protein